MMKRFLFRYEKWNDCDGSCGRFDALLKLPAGCGYCNSEGVESGEVVGYISAF
jgi:hypothetical protein